MGRAETVLARVVDVVAEQGFAAHAVHVLVGDESAAHRWSEDVPRDVHSVAKGVCVLAAGAASDDGLFDVDAPVARYLPDLATGDGVEHATTRHLLGMVSGVDAPWSPTWTTDVPDVAAAFLAGPSRGRVFQYSPASTYTAVRALAAVVGDVHAWLVPRLFEPLGVDVPVWDRCPLGHVKAAEGLHLRSGDLARVGQLLRDRGAWRGHQLVSPGWVDAMHTGWTVRDGAGPGYTHCALAGWGGPGRAWRLHGAHGQVLLLLDDAVVTVVADDHAGADPLLRRVVELLER
ncbi:serine hydrolase domain-containing protein [Quadrisphaera oryzae]|uniref:serine hydrolase domain-containing protein n=1 Tax=Quadrisphaera TaxID=317661 RepID=UPI001646500F|nr:serine hydrolase [Quadrisphaera sp. RL12-1S]